MTADALTGWGRWGFYQQCTNRAPVNGFQLKVRDSCGACDDSALNAIKLYCSNGGTIMSSEGTDGVWKNIQYCPTGKFVNSFRFRSEPSQGIFTDDTAGNDIVMKCNDGTILSTTG